MVYYPQSAIKPIKCPTCNTLNFSIAQHCVKCRADLTSVKQKRAENMENKE